VKRKVKFQEGGAVGESPRNRQLRETMEKFGREGRRVGLAERARQRETASQAARRAAAGERASALRDVAELNQRPEVQERNRRTSAEPRRIPTPPRPSTVRPMANLPPQAIPEPPRPSTVGTMRAAAPSAGTMARTAGRAIPGVGALAGMMPTSLEEGARFERAGLAQAREEQRMGDRAAMEQGMGEAPQRMPTPRPAAPRPAAAQAPRPRIREAAADELNEMELRRIRAERQMEEGDARERRRGREEEMMGGSGNIGAASARERGEQVGPPGDYNNFRKGGMVKPKKMMKGGMVAKPKAGATKAKSKPMPAFKKGGMIKKGKK